MNPKFEVWSEVLIEVACACEVIFEPLYCERIAHPFVYGMAILALYCSWVLRVNQLRADFLQAQLPPRDEPEV